MVNEQKLREWSVNIDSYNQRFASNEISEEVAYEIADSMMSALYEICEHFINQSSRRDNFSIKRFSQNIEEFFVSSDKLNTQIMFGFDYKGFYMTNYLSFQEHIKSANDDFWKNFILLKELGEIEIINLYEPVSKELEILKKETAYNKSILFQTVSATISQIIENEQSNNFMIGIRFDRNNSFKEIISTAVDAFEKLYELNYLLYRIEQRRN